MEDRCERRVTLGGSASSCAQNRHLRRFTAIYTNNGNWQVARTRAALTTATSHRERRLLAAMPTRPVASSSVPPKAALSEYLPNQLCKVKFYSLPEDKTSAVLSTTQTNCSI